MLIIIKLDSNYYYIFAFILIFRIDPLKISHEYINTSVYIYYVYKKIF